VSSSSWSKALLRSKLENSMVVKVLMRLSVKACNFLPWIRVSTISDI
jgi:hypothetical protein